MGLFQGRMIESKAVFILACIDRNASDKLGIVPGIRRWAHANLRYSGPSRALPFGSLGPNEIAQSSCPTRRNVHTPPERNPKGQAETGDRPLYQPLAFRSLCLQRLLRALVIVEKALTPCTCMTGALTRLHPCHRPALYPKPSWFIWLIVS